MTGNKKTLYLLLPLLILALAALACGTGYRTTKKISGSSGEVRVMMKEANGADSTSVEINEDWSWTRVSSTVTLSMETGSCRATLPGDEGTVLSREAASGSPAQVFGDLVTDSFGDLELQTECQSAQNLELVISFALK